MRSYALIREIAPESARTALAGGFPGSHAFVLHSALPDLRSRWSFFGADPFATFGPGRYEEALALWRGAGGGGGTSSREGFPPFRGGLVGSWSYDFGRRLERVPSVARDDVGWPDVWLAAYDVVGAFDHTTNRAWLIADPPGPVDPADARAKLEALARRLEHPAPAVPARAFASPARAHSTFTAGAYHRAVEAVREHIRRGDIFQANLSQRWTLPLDHAARRESPAANARRLFMALGATSPAPYSAFLDLGGFAVASSSPERFLAVRGRKVETRPIKGTRPRGSDPASDAANAAALRASPKDRAENVMIVDVLRNDLGRVAEPGSVEVPELCALESFPQVHHLVSTLAALLRPELSAIDLLHACFPGGSITGAPKIRAMEIIEAIEPVRRHLYTGAIGWLDWSGDADWNIAIRTALVTRDAIHFSAGGGITADSDPDAEYRETLDKAEGMRLALEAFLGPVALSAEAVRA